MQQEIVVILDNIRSVLNVGAILRTCDGAGIKDVCLCGVTPTVEHKKMAKTALGAEQFVRTTYYRNSVDAATNYKAQGYTLISVEQTNKSELYSDITYNGKVCLIFGNEITGVSPELLKLSDKIVELPMRGQKNSLNVATTAGIILYHATLK